MPIRKRTPTPAMNSGGIGKSGRCWTFFMPGPQVGVLANKNGGSIKSVYHLHSRQFAVFQMQLHALRAVQHAGHVSVTDGELSQ